MHLVVTVVIINANIGYRDRALTNLTIARTIKEVLMKTAEMKLVAKHMQLV